MARKDVFGSVMSQPAGKAPDVAPSFFGRSASRSIMQSFEDLSKAAVGELDPALIDSSFLSDRLEDDPQEHQKLLEAIRTNGQDSPILVRPNPKLPGRYQVVFGHRRLKVARELGRPVRAIVRAIGDREHAIAQGQENAARSDLSFIERTLFAKQILEQGHQTDVLTAALGLDETTLSKMRSVLAQVPEDVMRAIGPAKGIGRDRWWQLSKMLNRLGVGANDRVLRDPSPADATSEQRFDFVFAAVSKALSRTSQKGKAITPPPKSWAAADRAVSVTLESVGKKAVVTLKAKDGPRFAQFITERLDQLYREFRQSNTQSTGD